MTEPQPTIVVNDTPWPHREDRTVEDILRELDPQMPIAVVRVNGSHVPRATWTERRLQPGDEVRVVWIIAGG